jgi:hypothetical protein
MQSRTSDESAALVRNGEIPDIFGHLEFGPREHDAGRSVGIDQCKNAGYVSHPSFFHLNGRLGHCLFASAAAATG